MAQQAPLPLMDGYQPGERVRLHNAIGYLSKPLGTLIKPALCGGGWWDVQLDTDWQIFGPHEFARVDEPQRTEP